MARGRALVSVVALARQMHELATAAEFPQKLRRSTLLSGRRGRGT
jgi:hypothetical protein